MGYLTYMKKNMIIERGCEKDLKVSKTPAGFGGNFFRCLLLGTLPWSEQTTPKEGAKNVINMLAK